MTVTAGTSAQPDQTAPAAEIKMEKKGQGSRGGTHQGARVLALLLGAGGQDQALLDSASSCREGIPSGDRTGVLGTITTAANTTELTPHQACLSALDMLTHLIDNVTLLCTPCAHFTDEETQAVSELENPGSLDLTKDSQALCSHTGLD